MKKSSWTVLGAILALGLLVIIKIASGPRLSDEEQIHQLLNDAQSAVGRRDVWGAMACVASDYKDPSGNNHDRLTALTIQGFRSRERFIVTLENKGMDIQDKAATVNLDVSVGVPDQGSDTIRDVFSSQMTVELKKEPAKRWLIFPTEKWLITSITNLPSGGLDV